MILADTSVWAAHFRSANPSLVDLLEQGRVACHPFVIGELASGNLRDRTRILTYLERLPAVPVATHDEAMGFVEHHGLGGRGLGWVDLHLLASARLAPAALWTLDHPLRNAARRLGCEHQNGGIAG